VPALNAYFISGLEFAGGILLAIGLGSRFIAFLLAADMAVAYYVGDHEALLSFFSDPDKFYAAAPFTFLAASLIVLIFGPGKLALDTIIAKRFGPPPRPVHATTPAELQDSVSIPQP
jgi:putative oxidoreductase